MIVLQPCCDSLLQLIRNLDGLFKILLRNTAGCIVARHIPLLREDQQLLNQFGMGLDREFQGFNNLLMMSYLHSGSIAARSLAVQYWLLRARRRRLPESGDRRKSRLLSRP
jgi:hypothetical protein